MDARADAIYKIVVPYRGKRTVRRLIAAGRYDRVDQMLSDESCPQDWEGDEEVLMELVSLGNVGSVAGAVEAFDRLPGLRLANVAELLALGAKEPELQRRHPIVQIEKIRKGQVENTLLVCLNCHKGKRLVEMQSSFSGIRSEMYKFAAVNK